MAKENSAADDEAISDGNYPTSLISSERKGTNRRSVPDNSVSIVIRAKKEIDRKLLVAATRGDIAYLESVRRRGSPRQGCTDSNSKKKGQKYDTETEDGTKVLRDAVCVSGCTLLHWAAGSNQVGVLEYLLSKKTATAATEKVKSEENYGDQRAGSKTEPAVFCDGDGGDDDGSYRAVDLPVTRCKKSLGRTPLHYACRNGCLDAVKWLVLVGGASISVTAKQGVTPFQLAVWQNRLDICIFLTETAKTVRSRAGPNENCFDPARDFNDFGCGAVHWLGIAPESRANFNRRGGGGVGDGDGDGGDNDGSWYNDGRDLLPLARWLGQLPGIDFEARQRQNHTALHKASWGGHLALVDYLHREHDMWDDVVDDAGNYAASLADMAHTPKHARIAEYLRHHCSRKRAKSLAILGLLGPGKSATATPGKERIRKAYLAKARQLHPDRLMAMAAEPNPDTEGNATLGESATESPTRISFDELRKAYLHLTEEGGVGDQSNPAHSLNLMLRYVNNSGTKTEGENTNSNIEQDATIDGEEDTFFKARLVAVLLEYGDKGIDLSNVKKKWKQVWPEIPFPSQQREALPGHQAKKIPMVEFLMQKAGDVIRFERHGDKKRRVLVLLKNRNSSKESVLRSGSIAAESSSGERQ